MDHTAQRTATVTRSRFDRLLDILRICEQVEHIAHVIDRAEPNDVGVLSMQTAVGAIERIIRIAADDLSAILEAEQKRREPKMRPADRRQARINQRFLR
jgi:hypothetical protein